MMDGCLLIPPPAEIVPFLQKLEEGVGVLVSFQLSWHYFLWWSGLHIGLWNGLPLIVGHWERPPWVDLVVSALASTAVSWNIFCWPQQSLLCPSRWCNCSKNLLYCKCDQQLHDPLEFSHATHQMVRLVWNGLFGLLGLVLQCHHIGNYVLGLGKLIILIAKTLILGQ